jgi:hypothetical protein
LLLDFPTFCYCSISCHELAPIITVHLVISPLPVTTLTLTLVCLLLVMFVFIAIPILLNMPLFAAVFTLCRCPTLPLSSPRPRLHIHSTRAYHSKREETLEYELKDPRIDIITYKNATIIFHQ